MQAVLQHPPQLNIHAPCPQLHSSVRRAHRRVPTSAALLPQCSKLGNEQKGRVTCLPSQRHESLTCQVTHTPEDGNQQGAAFESVEQNVALNAANSLYRGESWHRRSLLSASLAAAVAVAGGTVQAAVHPGAAHAMRTVRTDVHYWCEEHAFC